METSESLCLREEEGKARHMTTPQSKRGQFSHLIILPAILFTCIHIFFIPGATVINKKDTGLHVRLNSGFCFSLTSMDMTEQLNSNNNNHDSDLAAWEVCGTLIFKLFSIAKSGVQGYELPSLIQHFWHLPLHFIFLGVILSVHPLSSCHPFTLKTVLSIHSPTLYPQTHGG